MKWKKLTYLIRRKVEIKAQSFSGGRCNKDEQIVQWVTRIKEDPTLANGNGKMKKEKKDKESKSNKTEEKMAPEKKIEDYRLELIHKIFDYTNKDINADLDMAERKKEA